MIKIEKAFYKRLESLNERKKEKKAMKEKMNNKGFSLVELIIVIAIMAILVVVLAPQYLKYVEKSRVSADAQIAVEFEGAMTVLASDPDVTLDTNKTYTVTSDGTGEIKISPDLVGAFDTAGSIDTSKTYKYTSTLFKAQNTSITLEYKDNVWKVTKTGIPDTNASAGDDNG